MKSPVFAWALHSYTDGGKKTKLKKEPIKTVKTVEFEKPTESRVDFDIVTNLVTDGSRVLDIGCSDGSLLELLVSTKNVDGRGIEISQDGVNKCVTRGLSVIQGDAHTDLKHYSDNEFDFVILSQTLQTVESPKVLLEEMLRVGRKSIVSLPNFGYLKNRLWLLFRGRMPVNEFLPYDWYETPNIHFCTIRDFFELCNELNATVEEAAAFSESGKRVNMPKWTWNIFGEQAVFLLSQ